jgi:hypothetical protein
MLLVIHLADHNNFYAEIKEYTSISHLETQTSRISDAHLWGPYNEMARAIVLTSCEETVRYPQ